MDKSQVDNKKIIGFDMDGVIIDHSQRKIFLAKKLGFRIDKKETPAEIIRELIPGPEYKRLQYSLYDHSKTSLLSPLMPGVKLILAKLQKSGIPFFLISRRRTSHLGKKLIAKQGLWPKYFNKDNTFFVKKIEDKDVIAKKLGITHYIDDEPRVLNALVSVKNKFLFDPSGAFKNPPHRRIRTWKEIAHLI